MAAMAGLLVVRVATLQDSTGPIQVIGPAAANQPAAPRSEPPRAAEAPRSEPPRAPDAAPGDPSVAERAILEALRSRRAELDAREAALAEREMLLAAAERRLSGRIEELQALQGRLEAENRARAEQNEQGMRQLVRLYEGMRPRDAAAIFDELELAVLVPVVDRMREARAAPVLAAMRPERARLLTTELARHRSRPTD
jgi:flagellar motility protein MotE (MotC chaperone)